MNKIKVSKNHILWLTYLIDEQPKYVVTSDLNRSRYYLYKINEDGGLEKVKSATNPCFNEVGG
jgi:hypothetical protein